MKVSGNFTRVITIGIAILALAGCSVSGSGGHEQHHSTVHSGVHAEVTPWASAAGEPEDDGASTRSSGGPTDDWPW